MLAICSAFIFLSIAMTTLGAMMTSFRTYKRDVDRLRVTKAAMRYDRFITWRIIDTSYNARSLGDSAGEVFALKSFGLALPPEQSQVRLAA